LKIVSASQEQATLHNALSDVASFGLSRSEAVTIARDMQKTVKSGWENLFKGNGFSLAEIERLQSCFIACDGIIQDNAGI
jgi:hypothetical protein